MKEDFLESYKIIQEEIKDVLLKHFSVLPGPKIKKDGSVEMINPELKNGIKYEDTEKFYKKDWEELKNILNEKMKEITSSNKFDILKFGWGSQEVKEKLDQILTKIENDNLN